MLRRYEAARPASTGIFLTRPADLVVLDRALSEAETIDLANCSARLTMAGGRIVHEA
jgi:predicted amidohydrolase YtcJ